MYTSIYFDSSFMGMFIQTDVQKPTICSFFFFSLSFLFCFHHIVVSLIFTVKGA